MRSLLLLPFLLILISFPARAQETSRIVIDLAEDHVDITSSFNGKNVTVFGTFDQDGDIAVVLRGPQSRIAVRKKKSSFGVWLNRQSVDFKHVPLFYSFATSRETSGLAESALLRQLGIGINALNFEAIGDSKDDLAPEFQEALIRTRQAKGLYSLEPARVRIMGQRLFRADFFLPGNVPTGNYQVEAFLFKNGFLVDKSEADLSVGQAGFSGSILNFAVDYSLAYAMVGLLMAMIAGFAAFWMSRSQRA